MSTAPTLMDVSRCYRLFLDREVEDATIAGYQLAGMSDLWALIHRISTSPEASRRAVGRACRDIAAIHDPSQVQIDASEVERAMLIDQTRERWRHHGLGVQYEWLIRDRHRYAHRSQKWNIEEMFARGRQEAEQILAVCSRHHILIDRHTEWLTLGFEAIRMAEALSLHVGAYLGVEISDAECESGLRSIQSRQIDVASLRTLTEFLATPSPCTFFYSVMTLQHAPPPVAYDILSAGLERLRPGGHAFFQLACQLYDYGFDPSAYLAGEGRNADGEIHALPQHHVLALMARHDLSPIEVLPDGRTGPLGISYSFLARKQD